MLNVTRYGWATKKKFCSTLPIIALNGTFLLFHQKKIISALNLEQMMMTYDIVIILDYKNTTAKWKLLIIKETGYIAANQAIPI